MLNILCDYYHQGSLGYIISFNFHSNLVWYYLPLLKKKHDQHISIEGKDIKFQLIQFHSHRQEVIVD